MKIYVYIVRLQQQIGKLIFQDLRYRDNFNKDISAFRKCKTIQNLKNTYIMTGVKNISRK